MSYRYRGQSFAVAMVELIFELIVELLVYAFVAVLIGSVVLFAVLIRLAPYIVVGAVVLWLIGVL